MKSLPAKETKGILTVHRRGLDYPSAAAAARSNEKNLPAVLIMLAGFPDSNKTWAHLAPLLEEKYHVVTMAYPGIDPADIPRLERASWWGYDLDDVTDALLALVREYNNRGGGGDVFLLGHDWGSFPVLKIANEHPASVTAVVSEDIGLVTPVRSIGLKAALVILGYQWLFVTIFVASRVLPARLGDWFCQAMLILYPWSWIGPVVLPPSSGGGGRQWTLSSPYQMHPYFHLHKNILLKAHLNPVGFTKVPLLYIFGRQKRVMFHSPTYLQRLDKHPDCRHVCYEDAGHWIHTTHPERMARDMVDFFEHVRQQKRE